ncbi:AAA family ATPase, partial [Halomonas sp. SIMBA_159]
NPKNNYVLILDEINRANLSSVLGELIYALEYRYYFDKENYQEASVESLYDISNGDDEPNRTLILPENLYIIGTMNTADR